MPLLPPNALQHRVILVSGEEDTWRRSVFAELKAAAIPEDGFDSESFVAGETSPKEWLASAGTLPFLSERRTVIVRNLLRAPDPSETFEGLSEGLGNLPPSGLLILISDDEPGDDQKQRDFDKRRLSWEAYVKKEGGLALTFKPDSEAVSNAVKESFAEEQVAITPKALAALLEMTGGSYTRAMEEAEKLKLYAGSKGQIQESDVQATVIPSREWSVFKLVDAIVAGNLTQAIEQLRNLVGTTPKTEDAAFRQVFPTLSTQFRRIWQARLCVEAKCSPQSPPPEVAAQFPAKGNLAKEKDWLQKRAMYAARSLSFRAIGECLQIISDADSALKGLMPSFSGIETLEQTVMKMVSVCKRAA